MSQSLLHEVFNGEELSELCMDVAETFDCIATPRPMQVANVNANIFLDGSKEDSTPEPQGTTSTANTEQTLVQTSASDAEEDLDYDDDEVNELTILTAKLDDLSSMDEDDEMSQKSTATTMSAFAPVHNLQTTSISSSSCVISLAKHISTSSLHVVKTFTKASISYDAPTLEHAMTEQMMLRLLTQMQVPFVLRLRWSFQDEETLRLITDYCSGGDLQSYVEQAGPLHPSQAWLYAAELADTLCTLHSSGITHRAISPEHILIGPDGHIVLTGFSRACITSFTSPRSVSSTSTKAGRGGPSRFNERPRHGIWTAPEVVLGWKSDYSIDWWGFGCILGYMLGARHPIIPGSPLQRQQSLHDRIIESSIIHAVVQPRDGTDEYDGWDLVSLCLEPNPRLRAGADEVAGHQYFADLDWKSLRSKKYPAPPPLKRAPSEEELDTDDFMESRSLREHETLHGVNIAGFNYENEDGNAIIQDHQTAEISIDEDLSVSSSDDDDLRGKPEAVPPESTYVTPAGSVVFNSSEVGLGSPSRGSSSTALYSCTSFGELREALKTNPSEKFPLPVSRPTSMPPFESGSDFQSNAANRILDRPHDPGQPSRPHSLAMYSYQESRPTSVLVRQGSDVWTQETPTKTEFSGLGLAKGLGLRKYASLDFDLDTVVSLDVNPRRVSTLGHKASKSEGNIAVSGKPKPLRRVSFVDQDIISAEEQPVKAAPTSLQVSPSGAGTASPWKSLSKIYSPNSGGNPTRLRKRRMESTPVFPTTPHLNAMVREKVDLPPGLQQIGLGIGYKYSGPPAGPSKEYLKDKFKGSDTSGESRRALSTGPTIGLSRCTALFSGIRKSRSTNAGKSTPSSSGERISEESDAFGAVMREMGRADWDAELGFAGPSMSPAQAQSSRRKAGRVYSVDPGTGVEAFSGSTLRLIQDAVSPSDEFRR